MLYLLSDSPIIEKVNTHVLYILLYWHNHVSSIFFLSVSHSLSYLNFSLIFLHLSPFYFLLPLTMLLTGTTHPCMLSILDLWFLELFPVNFHMLSCFQVLLMFNYLIFNALAHRIILINLYSFKFSLILLFFLITGV